MCGSLALDVACGLMTSLNGSGKMAVQREHDFARLPDSSRGSALKFPNKITTKFKPTNLWKLNAFAFRLSDFIISETTVL